MLFHIERNHSINPYLWLIIFTLLFDIRDVPLFFDCLPWVGSLLFCDVPRVISVSILPGAKRLHTINH